MLRKTVAIWLMLLLVFVRMADAASVALVPTKDNTLIQWSTESAPPNPLLSNGQGDIFVGRTNQDGQEEATISIRRGLVKFDVAAAVPSGVHITSATLAMRDVRGRNGDPAVTLHRLLKDWGEGGSFFNGGQGFAAQDGDATWLYTVYNAANPATSPQWNTPGGDFLPQASGAVIVTDDGGEGQMFSWSGAGLVADVQSWLDQPTGNFGWLLQGDETRGQSAKRFNSRESTDAPNVPPTLVVEYSAGVAGDYTNDGRVDAADYTVWRNQLGAATALPNETVTPGHVTSEDYSEWKANFGAGSAGGGALAAVPEPGGILLAAVEVLGSLANLRKRGVLT